MFALLALLTALSARADDLPVRAGDLLFHRSTSDQSAAIAEATGSELTHVGVAFVEDRQTDVFEAVSPVRLTPLDEFVARGDGPTHVKRLRDDVLTPEVLEEMRALRQSWLGLPYDLRFAWTDDQLYCSELVWKLYDRAAGVKLGEPRPLGTYRLDGPEVSRRAGARFGGDLPLDQLVISPQDLYDSPHLAPIATIGANPDAQR